MTSDDSTYAFGPRDVPIWQIVYFNMQEVSRDMGWARVDNNEVCTTVDEWICSEVHMDDD